MHIPLAYSNQIPTYFKLRNWNGYRTGNTPNNGWHSELIAFVQNPAHNSISLAFIWAHFVSAAA